MPRILHLSDPHFGASDPKVAKAFLRQAPEMGADLTILSGDLSMRARHDELAAARDFVEQLPSPRLVIPGNHDVPGTNQPLDRFLRPFHRYRRYISQDLEPSVTVASLQVVSLNSNRAYGLHADWSEGFLSPAQLEKTRRAFAGGPPDHWRILVLHHPLLSPLQRLRSVVHPLPELLATIHACRVDAVLCGHFHQSQLATAGILEGWKCVVSQASTVCSTRLQGEPQGFHVLDFGEDEVVATRHAFEEERFFPDIPIRFQRGSAGWSERDASHSMEIFTPSSTTP